MKTTLFYLIAIFTFSTGLIAQKTTIYLSRHAEKVLTDPTNKDPLLTDKGNERAQFLVKYFKKNRFTAIYSTNTKRTILSVEPLAQANKLETILYNSKELNTLRVLVLTPTNKASKNNNIYIVGHSNTILETIEALGGKRPISKITEEDYDYLFKVIVKGSKVKSVKLLSMGL
jgi:2,3-bisphosphoglycerate-dependent phosphoglycerate mutase